ncbi:MAG TPA: type II secretion system protein [Verrucomicrobiae bacterium]|nr:type II secretion system protein [Verrucomicrobiae bacterium]
MAAFTMIEIAISLAVIGFALIAIIGVLPMGLNVQQQNRQETIIDQDAAYWMDAIRSGAHGLYDLTNYVESITVTNSYYGGFKTNTYPADYYPYYNWNNAVDPQVNFGPQAIIGLLSTPKYVATNLPGGFVTNFVTANVLAISGNASEKPPQTNSSVRDLAFAYRLMSEVVPYQSFSTNSTNFGAYSDPQDWVPRSNAWLVARSLQTNLYEVRLTFRWPLYPNGHVGNGAQTFRTMVSSTLMASNGLYFFQPNDFAKAP